MTNLQEPDQVTYSFLFIITPLEIVSTKSIKNLKKSLLLKLGDRTQKTSQLNKPFEIPVDVLYSKTLKKYCPIKGIIKVYDINLDGSEVISSVGGFQTQEILNEQKNNVIIERDVGTSKIKMKIQIKNLGIVKSRAQTGLKIETFNAQSVKKQQNKYPLARSRIRQNSQQVQPTTLQKSRILQPNTQKVQYSVEDENKKDKAPLFYRRSTPIPGVSPLQSVKLIDAKKVETGSTKEEIQQSNQGYRNNFSRKKPQQVSEHSIKSIQVKKNETSSTEVNRQTKNVSQIYSDQLITIKQILKESQKEREGMLQQFQKILNGLYTKNGKIWIQNNQKDKTLSVKYKERGFDRAFNAFVEFMVFQISKLRDRSYSTEQEHNISSIETKLQKQLKHLTQQLSRKTNQIFTLRAKQRQKTTHQPKPNPQQLSSQNTIKDLQNINKTLKQQNNYLKQKDQTMQQIITQKQNQIENLKQEITEIDLEFKEMQSTLKNDACEIQELKQEVSNLNQVIESYRQKYGDLKNIKNRALENQLKECLIWIDQQTRQLQMSDFAEDTQPSHSHNVSEILKNIELEGASRQQMNSIKIQLSGLIRRIDNFLAK